ncbi:hypothetical protein PG994_014132 [Apiospora phragmitis]|uniref:Carboxylic ester hydrolase n=1 Tax=Apiospora phragmitis TaxID=2905665 RepID=A0ABR1T3F3_9PEZI
MVSTSALTLALSVTTVTAELPIVNLGYARHRAIALNETGDYYNFTNIRYGQSPVGNLRRAAPKAPVSSPNDNITIYDGSEQGGNCPQSFPCWFQIQTAFSEAWNAGEEFDFNSTYASVYADGVCDKPTPEAARPAGETEDCLFLDVYTPRTKGQREHQGPCLVYIFGGGFTGGSKSSFGYNEGSPAGLIDSSRVTGPDGLIYVALNYRLGALGWMFGSEYTAEGGLTNAGLYDQRLALEWVRDNIHLFGGDSDRVTVMGESAGGGSIIMQMTAFGSGEKPPFQQVVTQSAAWEPASAGPELQNQIYKKFLGLLNVASLEEARKLPSQQIIDANHILLASSNYGSVFLGPVVDGAFVPDDPKRLLRDGKVDTSVKIMTTIAADEGLRFAPANITSEADFEQFVALFLNPASESVRAHVRDTVYPPVFDGSLPWTNQRERASVLWAELVSTCNARYLHAATASPGYATLFDVWPALHQGDVPYVFWNDNPLTTSPVNGTVARVTQDYITAFAMTGEPGNRESPALAPYDRTSLLALSGTGFPRVDDPTNNTRCEYWHDATYQ